MIGAGKRRERLTFQQRGLDANGDRLGPWDVAGGVIRWGRVVSRTRGEGVLQQRLQGVQPAELTVLADSETRLITTAWRMVWNATPYNIRAVAPDETRAEIYILAEADQSDA